MKMKIILETDPERLSEKVSEHLQANWKLHGTLIYIPPTTFQSERFLQALVWNGTEAAYHCYHEMEDQ